MIIGDVYKVAEVVRNVWRREQDKGIRRRKEHAFSSPADSCLRTRPCPEHHDRRSRYQTPRGPENVDSLGAVPSIGGWPMNWDRANKNIEILAVGLEAGHVGHHTFRRSRIWLGAVVVMASPCWTARLVARRLIRCNGCRRRLCRAGPALRRGREAAGTRGGMTARHGTSRHVTPGRDRPSARRPGLGPHRASGLRMTTSSA